MKVLKTIKTKTGKEIKIYEATLEEMDNEYKNRLNFTYEELMDSESSENGLTQFSERLDEIWFQNWKKSELESIEKLEELAKKKSEEN